MNTKASEDLAHIKEMMERSSRFISLSGLSGVGAGIIGLITEITAMYLTNDHFDSNDLKVYDFEMITILVGLGISALFLAIFLGCFFTIRKSNHLGLAILTSTSNEVLTHLFSSL